MIHQLLTLTRPLFVLDTETTGTDPKTDRIVEIGFQRWEAAGMTKEWRSLINPSVSIPASATKVHGITDDDVAKCKACERPRAAHLQPPVGTIGEPTRYCEGFIPAVPSFKQLAANIASGLRDCDYAGKNVRFDLRIMAAEMRRAGQAWDYSAARIIDIDRLEQIAVPRSLSHLHEKYVGQKHDGAHGALSDVRAATSVIVKQLEAHASLSRDLDTLHQLQWPGWLCDGGEFRMIDGVPVCMFGKWRGQSMRRIDPGYWDFILKNDFPADVKALASAAKMGKFPEQS